MNFTDELFESASGLWAAQLDHPFVRGLADGSLEEERFARWVRQDYRYLKEFARVFAWAAAKADDQRYADWIEQYASDEFAEATDRLRAELDRRVEHVGPARRQRLTEIFLLSTRYEWMFWEMCWHGEQWPV